MELFPLPTNLIPYWMFPWNTNSWSGFTQFIFHKELLAIDAIRQLFPWKVFGFEMIKGGQLPLWNPFAFSGQPLLANLQSSFFYPLAWFFLLFDSKLAWLAYIFSQPIILSLGILIWLKEKKYSLPAIFFAIFSILFSSFFVTRYFWGVYLHSLIWIPFGLFLTERYLKNNKLKNFILGSVIVYALTILGGYPQHSFFALLLMFAYNLYKLGIKGFVAAGTSLILALSLTAVQLLPSVELYKYSARDLATSTAQFTNSQLNISHLATLISPDFYGSPGVNNFFSKGDYSGTNNYFGIIPLIFAVSIVFIKKNREQLFWLGVIAYGFLMSLATPLGILPKILNIPILSSGAAWNNLFFVQFGGIILATSLFQLIVENKNAKQLKIAAGIVLLFSSFLLIIGFQNSISFKNTLPYILISFIFFITTFFPKKLFIYSTITLVVLPGLYLFNKVSPFGKIAYFYPSHPAITFLKENAGINRYWGIGGETIPSNLGTYFRIYDPQGYDSLWPKWYGEFVAAAGKDPQKIFDRAVVEIPKEDTEKTKKLVNFLGIKYFFDKSDKPRGDEEANTLKYPVEKFERVRRYGQINIFENKESVPRIFLAKSAVFTPINKHLSIFYSNSFDPKNSVLIESKSEFTTSGHEGNLTLLNYSPNEIIMNVKVTSKSAPLVLTDTFYPGWKATIDDRNVKIARANYAFREIEVPNGDHIVKFFYDPDSFRIGKLISMVTLLSLIILFIWKRPLINDKK